MEDPTIQAQIEERDEKHTRIAKWLGAATVFVLGLSAWPRKSDAVVLQGAKMAPVAGIKNVANTWKNPATEGTLATVRAQTDKFTVDAAGNLYVQAATTMSSQLENASNVIINPATEDTLLLVKAQTNKLNFASSGALNTLGTAPTPSDVANVKNLAQSNVNPAELEMVQLWARIAKRLESQASFDINGNQRMAVDTFGASTDITTGVGNTTATTLLVALASDAGVPVTGVNTPTSYNGWDRGMFIDVARLDYARGIRTSLSFS